MTSREAEAALGRWSGLTRRHARRVLAGGLAGEPVRAGQALLHDPVRVHALARRTFVEEDEVDQVAPDLLVLRRDVHAMAPLHEISETLSTGWDFSAYTRVAVRVRIERRGGRLPVVATTAGFVTAGADLLAVTVDDGDSRLTLAEPGGWFDTFRDRRYATGPGRPWWIRGWAPSAT